MLLLCISVLSLGVLALAVDHVENLYSNSCIVSPTGFSAELNGDWRDPNTNPHCPDASIRVDSYVGGEEVAVSCPSQITLMDKNDEPEQCLCYTSVTLNPTVNETVNGESCTVHSLRVRLATNCIEDGGN